MSISLPSGRFFRLAALAGALSITGGCASWFDYQPIVTQPETQVAPPEPTQPVVTTGTRPVTSGDGFGIIRPGTINPGGGAQSAAADGQSINSVLPDTGGVPAAQLLGCLQGGTYQPIEPVYLPTYREYGLDGTAPTETVWPTERDAVDRLLPNIASDVQAYDLGASAGIGPFSASTVRKRAVIDFMKYRSEPVFDAGGGFVNFARIGVGIRLEVDVNTVDAGLDVTSLISLAASARTGKTSGRIIADVIGLSSRDITLSAPLHSDLSLSAIQKILQDFAAIRVHFNDPDTRMTPHAVAIIDCG